MPLPCEGVFGQPGSADEAARDGATAICVMVGAFATLKAELNLDKTCLVPMVASMLDFFKEHFVVVAMEFAAGSIGSQLGLIKVAFEFTLVKI